MTVQQAVASIVARVPLTNLSASILFTVSSRLPKATSNARYSILSGRLTHLITLNYS